MPYKPSLQIGRSLEDIFAIDLRENIQEPIEGLLGRETDLLVDASSESGRNNTAFVRVADQPDFSIAEYDPLKINIFALGYDAPIILQKQSGKLMIEGGSPRGISEYFGNGLPGIYNTFDADSGGTIALVAGSTLTVAGGTGIDSVSDGVSTITLSIDSTVVTLTDTQTLQNKTLTTPTIASFANATHSHLNAAGGGTLSAAAIGSGTFDIARIPTITLAKGGLGADVSAYDGFIRISGGTTSNLKSTFNSTAAPTTGDDSGDGFVVGSRWIDTTNDKEYVCLDNSLGAAVWAETTAAGVSGTLFTVDGDIGSGVDVSLGGTLEILGFSGISTNALGGGVFYLSVDSTVVRLTGAQTLEDKTLTYPLLTASSSAAAAINMAAGAAPSSPVNGDIWNDSTANALKSRLVGQTLSVVQTILCGTTLNQASNTTSETSLIGGSITLPANFLKAGKLIRIHLIGNYNSHSSNTDLTLRVKINGTNTITPTSTLTISQSNRSWAMETFVGVLTEGGSGTVQARGIWHVVPEHVYQFSPNNASTTQTVDTTTTVTLDVTAQWTTANANNVWRCHGFSIEVMN